MKLGLFDSHAHYDDEAFAEDKETLLLEMKEKGVSQIMNVAASMESCQTTLRLAETHENIYGALGVHPSETADLTEQDMNWIRENSKHRKIKAIGEIGLDYYWPEPDREIQKQWFIRQLNLAREVEKPVIIHSRDAAQDTFSIMKEARAEEIGGVVHCYSYSVEMAREYLNMDFYFGIGGVLTFKNAQKLKDVAAYVPIDKIVLETDSPYLAPVPNRGSRNNSENLIYVAQTLAQIKGIPYDEIVEITNRNANRLYRIEENI
ncbi:MAG: TatD family hydrolase [Lachnospiraceae bacterium]|nr:TatD family hydrolase [Lachnospiraceae bacterium]